MPEIVENIKALLGVKPMFGICMGHQILGQVVGGKTFKLKFGHHGGNHPIRYDKDGTRPLQTRRISVSDILRPSSGTTGDSPDRQRCAHGASCSALSFIVCVVCAANATVASMYLWLSPPPSTGVLVRSHPCPPCRSTEQHCLESSSGAS